MKQTAKSLLVLISLIGTFGWIYANQPSYSYCIPSSTRGSIRFEKLQIGGWAFNSTATQKENEINVATLGEGEQAYEFSLLGIPQTRDFFYWQVWVDLNRDMDFNDSGEKILTTMTIRKQRALGKIKLPQEFSGKLLLRIMLSKGMPNNSCGSMSESLDFVDLWVDAGCRPIDPLQISIDSIGTDHIWVASPFGDYTERLAYRLINNQDTIQGLSEGGSFKASSLLPRTTYTLQLKRQCQDGEESSWVSYPKTLETLTRPCLKPDLDSIRIVYTDKGIELTYTGQQHQSVLWDFPNGDPKCTYRLVKNRKNLYFYTTPGENLLVRLKGTCSTTTESEYSDLLSFQTPCQIDSSKFFISKITDQTISATLVSDVCSNFSFLFSRDSLLADSLWRVVPYDPFSVLREQTIKDLMPNTRYFVKLRIKCFDGKTYTYSQAKSFQTLQKLTQCEPIDRQNIKITFFAPGEPSIRVTPPSVSSKIEVKIENIDGHEEPYSEFFSGYIFLNQIADDTKYRISIRNHCGTLQSTWQEFIFDTIRPFKCPVINGQRLQVTDKIDTLRVTYLNNPSLLIPGPYLWRYRQVGYPWLDSLLTDSNFVDLPLSLKTDNYYFVEVKSLHFPGCEALNNWSTPFEFIKRSVKPDSKSFTAKAIANPSLNALNEKLAIRPNPTQGLFTLELPKAGYGYAELYVMNLHGQKIYATQVELGQDSALKLDLSNHQQGVYQVFLRHKEHVFQNKLVLIK